MNEIEKLYENAGIEKKRMCKWTCRGNEFCNTNCEYYENTKEFYPPFTTEKQLELIKWLSKFNLRIEQPEFAKGYYFIETHTGVYSEFLPIFEEALTGIVNNLWQDLTEEEKEQIRGILK